MNVVLLDGLRETIDAMSPERAQAEAELAEYWQAQLASIQPSDTSSETGACTPTCPGCVHTKES